MSCIQGIGELSHVASSQGTASLEILPVHIYNRLFCEARYHLNVNDNHSEMLLKISRVGQMMLRETLFPVKFFDPDSSWWVG